MWHLDTKGVLGAIDGAIFEATCDMSPKDDCRELISLYKSINNHILNRLSILHFINELNADIEFPNGPGEKIFIVDWGIKRIPTVVINRNPTSIHKEVSITKELLDKCRKNGVFVVFAIQQAADPNYYTDRVAKPTDEFVFYVLDPQKKYSTTDLGFSTMFRLSELERIDKPKSGKIEGVTGSNALNKFL